MMLKREMQDWFDSLDDDDGIYIDDGGLCLRVTTDPEAYLEIGGWSGDEEDDGRRFLVKDRSGRGESVTLDAAELLSTFPMEVEFESGEPEQDEFSEWIDSAEVGDTFDHPDRNVTITRTE